MTPFRNRHADQSATPEVLDTSAVRSRIMHAVEGALDQAELLLRETTRSRGEATRPRTGSAGTGQRGRDAGTEEAMPAPAAIEFASAALTIGLPIAARAVKSHLTTRNARRAAVTIAPHAVRTHPVLLGAAVVGGAVMGIKYLRHMNDPDHPTGPDGPTSARRRGEADRRPEGDSSATGFDLDDEVARMEEDGGMPSSSSRGGRRLRGIRASDEAMGGAR